MIHQELTAKASMLRQGTQKLFATLQCGVTRWGLRSWGALNFEIDPQVVGFPYDKDPKKVPRISDTTRWGSKDTLVLVEIPAEGTVKNSYFEVAMGVLVFLIAVAGLAAVFILRRRRLIHAHQAEERRNFT